MSQAALVQEDRTSVSEQAYQYVRSLILAGDMSPGSVFTERKLAEQLNASRTPLRTAITRLIGEGLVERLSNGTMVIREVPLDELLQIMVIRRQLESEAAAQAALKAPDGAATDILAETRSVVARPVAELEDFWNYDDRFHVFVAESSGMPLLAQMIRGIRDKARMCHVVRMERNFSEQAAEHLKVLEAIERRDADAARAMMIEHTDRVRARFLRWFSGG
ncbi:GntR family transcriptional regulator (plasmid) [Paroceanicella profunda]|uniref:GntR family transcriptional regulator n=1 Tax=Paroceanicella profunda TaxID=2579971 RepID=A0A5B8G309_9RHOB|nr:GntR family transcriptional regulator [Paroceanicella profunda]QDL94484.1 GntR family transcriptional regulator [Paroceanicella profunda]